MEELEEMFMDELNYLKNDSYADILLNKYEDTFYFNSPSDKEAHLFETYLNDEVDYINDKILMLDRYRKKYEKAKVRARK